MGTDAPDPLSEDLVPHVPGVRWSVCVRGSDGTPVAAVDEDVALPTASVGKILLLLEVARAIEAGELDAGAPLPRAAVEPVADSGLWHTLAVEALPLGDVAALVGAFSDNLATNVLLHRVGLDAVARLATGLGLHATALHDLVRDTRLPQHAPTLSTGSAAELSDLARRVARGEAAGPAADERVVGWLSANADQSMVGSALVGHAGLDPIAHHASLRPDPLVWNKTGTDAGVRADVGALSRGRATVTWAAVAAWDAGAPDSALERARVWTVLRTMHRIGELVLDTLPADED